MALTLQDTTISLNTTFSPGTTISQSTSIAQFWNIPTTGLQPSEIKEHLLQSIASATFFETLSNLPILAALILRWLVESKNQISRKQILNKASDLDPAQLEEQLAWLKDIYFLYERKWITNPSQKDLLYIGYEEIFERLKEVMVVDESELFLYEASTYSLYKDPILDSPFQQQVHISHGLVLWKSRHQYPQDLYGKPRIFVNKKSIIPFCAIPLSYHSKHTSRELFYRDNEINYFISLYKTYILFQTQAIGFRKNGTLHKDDYITVGKPLGLSVEEAKIYFNRLTELGFIDERHDANFPSKAYKRFIQKPLMHQLKDLVQSIEHASFIIEQIREQRNHPFHGSDIQRKRYRSQWFSDANSLPSILESDWKKPLDFLIEIGLLEYSGDHPERFYRSTSLFWQMIHDHPMESLKEISPSSMVVGEDFTITVDPKLTTIFQKYILGVFCDLIQKDVMNIYKITKESIQHAIFAGYPIQTLIDMLSIVGDLGDAFLFNLRDWSDRIRKIYLKTVTVLEGDELTIEEIWNQLHPKMSQIKRIGLQAIEIQGEIPKMVQSIGKIAYLIDETKMD